MKTNTMLLIAGVAGIAYLVHKSRQKAAALPPGVAPMIAAKALPEEGAEVVFVEPAVDYYPAWGSPWSGPWGGSWGRGGGRRHHHHRGGGRRR